MPLSRSCLTGLHRDQELNKQIKVLCSELSDIYSSSLPVVPASLKHFTIDIDRSKWVVPSNRTPPRVQSPVKNEEIRKQIEELLRLGIIKHSQAGYYSQVLLASKPHTNKTEWRFCVDYRRLNGVTSCQSWSLPNTKQMFERLGAKQSKYFATKKVLCRNGLNPGIWSDRIKSYNCVPNRFYYLYGYLNCETYVNDCVVYGETQKIFLANLRKVFERFRKFKVALKPKSVD